MENNGNVNMQELNAEELDQVSGGKSGKGKKVKAVSGDSYVRVFYNRDADEIGVLYKGDTCTFLGETAWDDRPVMWYKVSLNGRKGWVSSKYTKLVD